MPTVADVVRWLENFAPLELAEEWDNVGLLWGDPSAGVEKVLTCLTLTKDVAEEAMDEHVDLIVSHHPILFRPVQKIRADDSGQGFLWNLAKAGVSVYSPHTAFDNTRGGINDFLAERLGLVNVGPLESSRGGDEFKVVVFTPEEDREAVLAAAFEAGAGVIGDYRECSFAIPGQGTFFGGDQTDPKVGQKGRRETVSELRLEFVCPGRRVAPVVQAVRQAHSYEEPAIDVVPLVAQSQGPGKGRIGELAESMNLGEFAAQVRERLGAPCVQMVGSSDRAVHRVGVVCGAGDDFLKTAALAGADVLLTGEARFHRALEARAMSIGLIVAGHYATERPGVEYLADRLRAEHDGLEVWASRMESDPLRDVGA